MIARILGAEAEAQFLAQLADGDLLLEPVTAPDLRRMSDLVATYADLPLGVVDASVIATAEQLGANAIATLDRRHFTLVRPVHVAAFDLLP
jgi:hypothetical protein